MLGGGTVPIVLGEKRVGFMINGLKYRLNSADVKLELSLEFKSEMSILKSPVKKIVEFSVFKF